MLQSIRMKNFRCFGDLTIDHLDSVNLIAGKNNTGKTALLEAMYLLLSPDMPELPTPVNILRGFESLPTTVDLETRWGWLFFNKETKNAVELSAVDDVGGARSIRISAEWHAQTSVEFGKPGHPPRTVQHCCCWTFKAQRAKSSRCRRVRAVSQGGMRN